MRTQGHPLDVKVKQNDVKIPILFYKFSVSNCVICLLLLEVCFANMLDCSDGLMSQCQGHTVRVKVKISSGGLNGVDKFEPYDFLITPPLKLRYSPLTQFEHENLAKPFLAT